MKEYLKPIAEYIHFDIKTPLTNNDSIFSADQGIGEGDYGEPED